MSDSIAFTIVEGQGVEIPRLEEVIGEFKARSKLDGKVYRIQFNAWYNKHYMGIDKMHNIFAKGNIYRAILILHEYIQAQDTHLITGYQKGPPCVCMIHNSKHGARQCGADAVDGTDLCPKHTPRTNMACKPYSSRGKPITAPMKIDILSPSYDNAVYSFADHKGPVTLSIFCDRMLEQFQTNYDENFYLEEVDLKLL